MKLSEALRIDLDRLDQEMIDLVKYDRDLPVFSIIKKSIIELIRSGGKRLRPMMVIVGSRFGSEDAANSPDIAQLAAAAEFIHAASLIHDDIIDRSDLRRNAPTLHVKTDVNTAAHIANYMMARVTEIILSRTEHRERYMNDFMAAMPTRLVLGEYQQLNHRFDFDVPLATYLEKTNNKTALLMATCLQVGAKAAGAEDGVCKKLYAFGEAIGMAFQIRDDIFDFVQPESSLGKPAGADLMNGQITLPVIYALEDPELGARIRTLHEGSSAEQFQEAVWLIRQSGAIERVVSLSDQYMEEAQRIMKELESFPAYYDLETIWKYFNRREN